MEKKQNFLGGAAVLAAGMVIVKIIGALFKIPLYSILGEGGSADFYNAYSIYAALLTVSTAGLPVALSKMVSEANAKGNEKEAQQIFRVAFATFLVISAIFFCTMTFASDTLAGFLHNEKAALGIRVLAPAVVCVGLLSAFRGFAQGHSNMIPTAVSQIIEALSKLIIGLGLAFYLIQAGHTDTEASAGAIGGVTIGTALAAIYMIVEFFRHKQKRPADLEPTNESNKSLFKRLIGLAIPITLASSMVSLVTLVDTSVVQGRLQNALHYTLEETRIMYGTYTSGMNLYNLPAALITSFTISVIPAVSSALARKDKKTAQTVSESAIRLSAILAFPMGLGLWALGTPIMQLLYPKYNSDLGGPLLSTLGLAALFVCITLVTNSVMQANGFIHLPVVTMVAGGILEIIVDYILVGIPAINIHGAPIGTIVCFGVPAILNLWILRRVLPKKPNYINILLRPLLAAGFMGIVARTVYAGVHKMAGNTVSLVVSIVIAVVMYALEAYFLKILNRDTVLLLPKGEKIAKFLKL